MDDDEFIRRVYEKYEEAKRNNLKGYEPIFNDKPKNNSKKPKIDK